MEFSLALFGVGFATTLLGSLMLYMSLRKGPEDAYARHFGIIVNSLEKIRASRRVILATVLLGGVVLAGLYAASLMGWIRW